MTPEATWLTLLLLLTVIVTAAWVGWHLAMLSVERKRHVVAAQWRDCLAAGRDVLRHAEEADHG